jgi:TolB-like protein
MLLTGSVRSSAGVIRLTASLVDARMGTYVWTEAYDMPADDPVLTLQTGLAAHLGSRFATPSGVMEWPITQAPSKSGILPASLPASR